MLSIPCEDMNGPYGITLPYAPHNLTSMRCSKPLYTATVY